MMFYHPRDNSGTLRLSVLTAQSKGPVRTPTQILADITGRSDCEAKQLPNGMWATSWDSEPVEEGVTLLMRSWSLHHLEGNKLIIAMFTFTLEKSRAADPQNVADMAMVDNAIHSCEFALSPPDPPGGKGKFLGLFSKLKK